MEVNPLVSVYITTHNRIHYLKRALDSVLKQTYKNLEIIISDDGSSDGTREYVLEQLEFDCRLKYVFSEKPKGANFARNKALFSANGTFITGLDDDDTFELDRIEKFIIDWNDKYSFICHDFYDVYSGGKEKKHYSSSTIISTRDLLLSNLASNQVFTLTSRLIDIGGFNTSLKRLQDWECWIRLSSRFGDAKRFKYCTYKMFHNNLVRVSKSQSFSKSRKILVENNMQIYNVFPHWFIKNYLTGSKFRAYDLLRCKTILMFKCVILTALKKYEK